jgi:hypothetical protein
MAKKDIINLAKGKKPATKRKLTAKNKTTAEKKVETTLTPEQERDLKAKAKVQELLEDSSINKLTKKDDLIEIAETPEESDKPKGIEWLEEQVILLRDKNEKLQLELIEEKEKNNDDVVKKSVIELFNELQENHIKLGVDSQGIGNFRIYCPGFLNRMIKFFPFLKEIKRYN